MDDKMTFSWVKAAICVVMLIVHWFLLTRQSEGSPEIRHRKAKAVGIMTFIVGSMFLPRYIVYYMGGFFILFYFVFCVAFFTLLEEGLTKNERTGRIITLIIYLYMNPIPLNLH